MSITPCTQAMMGMMLITTSGCIMMAHTVCGAIQMVFEYTELTLQSLEYLSLSILMTLLYVAHVSMHMQVGLCQHADQLGRFGGRNHRSD